MISTRHQLSKPRRTTKHRHRHRKSLQRHYRKSLHIDNEPIETSQSKGRSSNKIRPLNNDKFPFATVIDHHSHFSKKLHKRSIIPTYSLNLSGSHRHSQLLSQLNDTSIPKQTPSHRDHDEVLNCKRKRRKQRKKLYAYCHCCTSLSAILSILAAILVFTAIATIPIAILFKNKSSTTLITTITTTSTSSTTSVTPSTTSTTSSTSSTSSASSTTSTTSSTTSLTSSTSTTTVRTCAFSCLNQTWISTSNLLAKWTFDETFLDDMNTYNATAINSPTFIASGYINQALLLNGASSQYLYTSYIPLINASFTIDLWLYPTGYPNPTDHSILGLCTYPGNDQCLHLTIRNSSGTYRLYMSFFGDNCESYGIVALNTWSHAAFTFDSNTHIMLIYLNGQPVGNATSAFPLQGTPNLVTIGYIPGIVATYGTNFFQGYIDQLTVSNRVKPTCEILDDATLVTYYNFDSNPILTDSGPNSLLSTSSAVDFVSSGQASDAISFNDSTSYLQIADLTGLGIPNNPFSISLWIRPYGMLGTIVFVSQTSVGSIWCASFIGFAANGALVAQLWNGAMRAVYSPTNLTASVWHHIVETWSSTNGLRLYIDNVLVASDPSTITYAASSASDYVTLANRPNNSCALGAVGTLGGFFGDIDEFRVYSREITIDDVCALYHN